MRKTSITLVLSFIQERKSIDTQVYWHLKRKPNVEAEYERGAILQLVMHIVSYLLLKKLVG